MIPCSVCNVNTIDEKRNKRKKCKLCADRDSASNNKKNKQVSCLTFKDGCKAALHNNTNAAIHASSLLACHPIKLNISKYNKTKKNIIAHALLHDKEVQNISEELGIDFGDTSGTFEANIQLSEQVVTNDTCKKCDSPENTINFQDISKMIPLSSVPNLLKMLGPYEEIDTEIISRLNSDFRMNQSQLYLIPKLFTGALVHNNLTLMAITSEVYSRHATIDIHLETGVDSVPSSKCYYKGLSCSVIVSFDGKNLSKKLIISSHTMNVLITCSTTIVASRLQEVFVGPQVNVSPTDFNLDSTRIFLRSEEVTNFKKAFDSSLQSSSNHQASSISGLRQLSSSFNHVSTYACLRATLDDFNDTRFMPVTVFTLCDTADQDGYGSNHNSAPKIGSLLLQTIAVNLILDRSLTKENVLVFQTAYESALRNEDNELWKIIDQIVNQMNTIIEQNNDKPLKMSNFIVQANLSKVANLVGSHLHKANIKIAINVKGRLSSVYG